jgi:starvation-inducible DNA-binding protein
MKIKMIRILLLLSGITINVLQVKAIENTDNSNSSRAELTGNQSLTNTLSSADSSKQDNNVSSFAPGYEQKFMTQLRQEDAGEIANQLNVLLATMDALCIKTRGFTANIVSPDFYEFHTFFNLTIKYLQEASYEVAERVRSVGPVGTMANTTVRDVQKQTKIRDARTVITNPEEMIAELWQDYITISTWARGIFRMAASIGDAGTIALMTKTTNQLEHFLWELRVMSGRK